MPFARITSRGRVTIPKEIREKFQLEPGDRVVFVRIGDDVYMQSVKDSVVDKMGAITVDGPQDFEKIRKETIKKRGKERGDDSFF